MMNKKNRTAPFISLLLLLAVSFGPITRAGAQVGAGRERRVGTQQPAATPQQTPKPTPTPRATPTPTPQLTNASLNPVVKPRVPAPTTLEGLRTEIQAVLRDRELESAQMAVK